MSSTSKSVAWERLVRYTPKNSNQIRYGEPILTDKSSNDVAELAERGLLQVRILEGPNALEAKPTDQYEEVGKLLGPVAAQETSIIRCIGLNYKTHSKSRLVHANSRQHNENLNQN